MKQARLAAKLVFVAAAAVASAAHAQVSVSDAWARATVAQQTSSGAYMQITSARAARVIGVQTPVAGVAEIHEMKMDGDVMKMRAIPALELPAGKPVSLSPGSYHVMLMDLKAPLKAGDTVALTLMVEDADHKRESVVVKAVVRAAGGQAPAPEQGHMHMPSAHPHQH